MRKASLSQSSIRVPETPHLHDADTEFFRKIGHHRAAEIIDERNAARAAGQRRNSVIPLSHLPVAIGRIEVRQHLKAWVDRAIALFNPTAAFHVRLPEAKVDVEIRVGRGEARRDEQERRRQKAKTEGFFHNDGFDF